MSEYVLGNNISQTVQLQLQQQPRWRPWQNMDTSVMPTYSTNADLKLTLIWDLPSRSSPLSPIFQNIYLIMVLHFSAWGAIYLLINVTFGLFYFMDRGWCLLFILSIYHPKEWIIWCSDLKWDPTTQSFLSSKFSNLSKTSSKFDVCKLFLMRDLCN